MHSHGGARWAMGRNLSLGCQPHECVMVSAQCAQMQAAGSVLHWSSPSGNIIWLLPLVRCDSRPCISRAHAAIRDVCRRLQGPRLNHQEPITVYHGGARQEGITSRGCCCPGKDHPEAVGNMIVFNCKHMDRDHLRLMALGSDAEKGHRVAVASHIDVRGKLV